MTLLALVAIIFFGFATYNLTCAFVDIPTKKTSRMMMLARKQQGVKAEKLLDVYITKIAGLIAPYLKLDKLKRNKLQRALDIAGLELTPEVYTARAWVTAGAVGLSSILMVFLVPLMVPVLIGLAVALWFSTYYSVFDFVKKRRKLIESEIPRFALTHWAEPGERPGCAEDPYLLPPGGGQGLRRGAGPDHCRHENRQL